MDTSIEYPDGTYHRKIISGLYPVGNGAQDDIHVRVEEGGRPREMTVATNCGDWAVLLAHAFNSLARLLPAAQAIMDDFGPEQAATLRAAIDFANGNCKGLAPCCEYHGNIKASAEQR